MPPGAIEATRADWRSRMDPGKLQVWLLAFIAALIVLPPFYFLVKSSVTVVARGRPSVIGWANFERALSLGGWELWQTTLTFAAGSSALSILIGVTTAWLVARTDVAFRSSVFVGAFLSLSAPLIVKGIGWILLLGPNNGLINNLLRWQFGLGEAPIALFSLGGMIFVEGLLWAPVAFLLMLPAFAAMDPSLEEAAATAGASRWQVMARVTFPLVGPSMLAVLLLSFIRALEAFEVPLLIGVPGQVQTATTALYQSMHTGLTPRYGEASAYAVMLIAVVALPMLLYYRATQHAGRFATVTGKGFRPQRIELGWWRWPATCYVLIIPLSLAAPMLIMLWAALLPSYTTPTPADLGRLTVANFVSVGTRSDTLAGLVNSVFVGAIAASLVSAAALFMAWAVVRRSERSRWAIDVLASLPLVFPGIVLGIAILVQFLNMRFIPLYGTLGILVFAFLVKYMPYGMRFGHAGLLSISRDLEDGARMSGAGPATVLWRIVLPLAVPAFAAIWVYVFMHAIRDLSLAVLLSGPNTAIVSIVMLDLWNNGELPQLAALSIIVALLSTLLGVVFMQLSLRQGLKV